MKDTAKDTAKDTVADTAEPTVRALSIGSVVSVTSVYQLLYKEPSIKTNCRLSNARESHGESAKFRRKSNEFSQSLQAFFEPGIRRVSRDHLGQVCVL